MPRMPSGKLAGLTIAGSLLAACVSPLAERAEPRVAVGGDSPVAVAIHRVAAESGVSAPLLATLVHLGSRFQILAPAHTHGREVVGIFGLDPGTVARGVPARACGSRPDTAPSSQ